MNTKKNSTNDAERQDVLKSVCHLVSEHLGLTLKYVKEHLDTPFLDIPDSDGNPAFDELDFIELIMAFEEEFSIEIPEEDVEQLSTVNGAVDYIMTAEVVDYDDEDE